MPRDVVVLFNQPDGEALIRRHCAEAGVPFGTLEELLETEIERSGLQRRHGLREAFDDILDRMDEEPEPSR
jgi:hypothetical protein